MRIACLSLVLAVLAVSGCSSRSARPANPYDPSGSAAMMPSGYPLGHTQPSSWDKVSSAVTDNPVTNGVSSAFNSTTDKVGSYFKSDPPAAPPDATSLSTGPKSATPALHVSMAKVLEKSGKMTQAESHYRRALAKEPRNIDALLGYAHLLDRHNRLDEARQKYELACKYHPQDARAYNDLGLCYARQKRLSESLDSIARAVQLQPQRKLYRNNIATVLIETGRQNEAFTHLAAVNTPAVANYNMGYLLHQKGDNVQAAHYFQQAVQADPSFVAARQMADRLSATTVQSPTGPSLNSGASTNRYNNTLMIRPASDPATAGYR